MIPAKYIRAISGEARVSTRDVLVQSLIGEEGAIELTKEQQDKLERVEEADRLIRSGLYKKREIEGILKKKFDYSYETARRDIADAEYIYGASRKLDKNYLLMNHLEYLDTAIRMALNIGDMKTFKDLLKLKNDILLKLPDNSAEDTAPAAIIFNINQNDTAGLSDIEMSQKEAIDYARKILSDDKVTDIDYEELDDES